MPSPTAIDTAKLAALDLTLTQVDPDSLTQADWTALNALMNRARAEAWPEDPPNPVEDTIKSLTNIPPFVHVSLWTLQRSQEWVAMALANYAEMETNQHLMQFQIYIVPELRRQGIGTELLKLVAKAAQGANRSLLMAESDSMVSGGAEFLQRIGAEMGLATSTNQLKMADLDRAQLQQWQARAQERAADLELGFWDDAYPEDEIDAVAKLLETMNTQPLDDMEIEDVALTPDQIRQIETSLAARGIERWTMYARDPQNGEFAGYTEVFWRPSVPENLRQEATAVVPAYRNRGLGRLLKAAMLEKVLADRPTGQTGAHGQRPLQ